MWPIRPLLGAEGERRVKIEFITDCVEITPAQLPGRYPRQGVRVSVQIGLEELLNDVSDFDLLEVMDIDNVRAWLSVKDAKS